MFKSEIYSKITQKNHEQHCPISLLRSMTHTTPCIYLDFLKHFGGDAEYSSHKLRQKTL